MPKAPDEELYSRGKYRLEWDRKRDGSLRSPFLQIVWYDERAGRNRSKSTGEANVQAAEKELDKHYLQRERGQAVCHACGQPLTGGSRHPVSAAIADYIVAREDRPSISSIRPRLAHVLDWLDAIDRADMTCEELDKDMIDQFRKWSARQPVVEGSVNPVARPRAPGTTEASVRQLAAAINYAHGRKDTIYPAGFTALPPRSVSKTPQYRCSVDELAKMFQYTMKRREKDGKPYPSRQNLLRFLQISVATWARPDAAHDVSTDPKRGQWHPHIHVLDLNPNGRAQTKKYRPALPVPDRMARLLDQNEGFYVKVASVRKAFEAMLDDLKMPRERETGLKVIRRSMSTLVRKRIGEEHWVQGEMFLGHRRASVSDLYALFDNANLGLALQATADIIEEIEKKAPGAFTGLAPELKVINGGINA